jgi:hypothetical protein
LQQLDQHASGGLWVEKGYEMPVRARTWRLVDGDEAIRPILL